MIMDDRISTYLSVALVFGALTIVYSLLALIPTALLCRFFGWPFLHGGLPIALAGAASTAFVRLQWHFATRNSQSENGEGGKSKWAIKWAKAESFILVVLGFAIAYDLVFMLLVGIGFYLFGQPITVGLLVLLAVAALGAGFLTVWQKFKDNPDWW